MQRQGSWRGLITLSSTLSPLTFTTKGFRKETDTSTRSYQPQKTTFDGNCLLQKTTPSTLYFNSSCPKRCKRAWFWPPDVKLSRTWKRLPTTERGKSLSSTDDEHTSPKAHKRKRGEQPTRWLNKRNHGQRTRNSIIWPAEIRQDLNQLRRSSTYKSQHSDDVTVTNANKQILPRSTKTRTTDYSRSKAEWCISYINQ